MNSIPQKKKKLSLILKIIVIVSAFVGTAISAYGDGTSFMNGVQTFMYFTTQSNIAIAIICAVGYYKMSKGKDIGNVHYVIKYVGTVAITLTGVVFCFVLAPTLGANAWNVHNVLTHVVVPIASIVDFFVATTFHYGEVRKFNPFVSSKAMAVFRFTPTTNHGAINSLAAF